MGVATPECKTLLLLNLAYDKEIDYQEEMERAWQFAKDNKSRYMPIVFPFSIKKKGDRSLFISHRPLDRANWTYLFRYEWYMTEEYTGDKNYRDLTKVDYFLEEDSTEVKDLWEKLRNNKPNPFSPVTKKNGKTIFTVHQPEKKYLKDYSLCFCVPLEDGYLDNIGFRKLDAVEYVNAAEK